MRLTGINLESFSEKSLRAVLAELDAAEKTDKLSRMFPDTGPLRRELYVKHLKFFRAGGRHEPMDCCPEGCDGSPHQERAIMAGNRVGKSVLGAYEVALHLTGLYPAWWEGRRFDGPIEAWAAGDTSETTRDIVQAALLGPIGELGTGMIPKRCIDGEPAKRMGVAQAVDTAQIKHASGGISLLGFKSYDQGRKKFQGTAKHVVWLDEESPADVYDECVMRLMTTNGILLCTFTPLEGLTEVALRYLPHLAPASGPEAE